MQATGVQTIPGSAQGPVEETHPGAAQKSIVKTSPGEAQAQCVDNSECQHRHLLCRSVPERHGLLLSRNVQVQFKPLCCSVDSSRSVRALQCRHIHKQLRSLLCKHLNTSSTCRLVLSRHIQVQLRPMYRCSTGLCICSVDMSRISTGFCFQTILGAAQAPVSLTCPVLQWPLCCRPFQVQLRPLCVDAYIYSSSLSVVSVLPGTAPAPVFYTSSGAAQAPAVWCGHVWVQHRQEQSRPKVLILNMKNADKKNEDNFFGSK